VDVALAEGLLSSAFGSADSLRGTAVHQLGGVSGHSFVIRDGAWKSTRGHLLDAVSDLTCPNATKAVSVDPAQVSCQQQVAGSSFPPAQGTRRMLRLWSRSARDVDRGPDSATEPVAVRRRYWSPTPDCLAGRLAEVPGCFSRAQDAVGALLSEVKVQYAERHGARGTR
jgi:hypothetical protein